MGWKSIEIEAVFTNAEMNNERNINFCKKNHPFGIQHMYSSKLFISQLVWLGLMAYQVL